MKIAVLCENVNITALIFNLVKKTFFMESPFFNLNYQYHTGAPEFIWTYCGQTKFVLNLMWTKFKNRVVSCLHFQKWAIFKALSQNMVWTSPLVHICSGAPVRAKGSILNFGWGFIQEWGCVQVDTVYVMQMQIQLQNLEI